MPGDGDRRVSALPSGLDRASGEALSRFVGEIGAGRTFETGLAVALSTLWIARGVLGSGRHLTHLAIDPFQARHWRNAGRRLIERAGLSESVEVVEEDSGIVLPRLASIEPRFDVAFIDGGHLFENVFLDLHFSLRLVRPGGWIIVDDLWMHAVRCALAYFERNLGLSLVDPRRAGLGRFALACVPARLPDRAWDHFEPFAETSPDRMA